MAEFGLSAGLPLNLAETQIIRQSGRIKLGSYSLAQFLELLHRDDLDMVNTRAICKAFEAAAKAEDRRKAMLAGIWMSFSLDGWMCISDLSSFSWFLGALGKAFCFPS